MFLKSDTKSIYIFSKVYSFRSWSPGSRTKSIKVNSQWQNESLWHFSLVYNCMIPSLQNQVLQGSTQVNMFDFFNHFAQVHCAYQCFLWHWIGTVQMCWDFEANKGLLVLLVCDWIIEDYFWSHSIKILGQILWNIFTWRVRQWQMTLSNSTFKWASH